MMNTITEDFLGGSDCKKKSAFNSGNAGDACSIPGHWNMPWRRKWQTDQYSHLENSMDREAWKTAVHGVIKSRT